MTKHHPAAFINTIHESGSKNEAVQHLQETWNELCEAKAGIERLREALSHIAAYCEAEPQTSAQAMMAKLAREALRDASPLTSKD